MSPEDMRKMLNNCNEYLDTMLSSINSFNYDINISPQYLFKSRKQLETIIEQVKNHTEWFTLSIADNHWQE